MHIRFVPSIDCLSSIHFDDRTFLRFRCFQPLPFSRLSHVLMALSLTQITEATGANAHTVTVLDLSRRDVPAIEDLGFVGVNLVVFQQHSQQQRLYRAQEAECVPQPAGQCL